MMQLRTVLPDRVKAAIEKASGLDIALLSSVLIQTALKTHMEANKFESESAYFDYILERPEAFKALLHALLVPETWFFRDHAAFEFLLERATQLKKKQSTIRVLSAPCSTGEEPYSLAITLQNAGFPPPAYSIDAIDLNEECLEKARLAEYAQKAFRPQDPVDKNAYFSLIGQNTFALKKEYRDSVYFQVGNLASPHFLNKAPKYSVIFLRNVLIYLTAEARKQVVENVERLLEPGGLLFLGYADSIVEITQSFKAVGPVRAFAYTAIPKEETRSKPRSQLKSSAQKAPTSSSNQSRKSQALLKAQTLADQDKLHEAKGACYAYIETYGESTEVLFLLAQIFAALDDLGQAQVLYKKIIGLDSSHAQAQLMLKVMDKALNQG